MRIEKHVPVPPAKQQWNFGSMETGDCMVIEGAEMWRKALSSSNQYTARHRVFFRKQWDAETKTGRIWRTT